MNDGRDIKFASALSVFNTMLYSSKEDLTVWYAFKTYQGLQ